MKSTKLSVTMKIDSLLRFVIHFPVLGMLPLCFSLMSCGPIQSTVYEKISDADRYAALQKGSDNLSWAWPTSGKIISTFSESKGLDIAGNAGDPIVAARDGRVVYSGTGLRGYGKMLIIKHDTDYRSAYANNQNILVNEGQSVTKGQKIAEMGNTDSDQVKLHFEVRYQGSPVDPLKYLPPLQVKTEIPNSTVATTTSTAAAVPKPIVPASAPVIPPFTPATAEVPEKKSTNKSNMKSVVSSTKPDVEIKKERLGKEHPEKAVPTSVGKFSIGMSANEFIAALGVVPAICKDIEMPLPPEALIGLSEGGLLFMKSLSVGCWVADGERKEDLNKIYYAANFSNVGYDAITTTFAYSHVKSIGDGFVAIFYQNRLVNLVIESPKVDWKIW
jgi:hypothetical protein